MAVETETLLLSVSLSQNLDMPRELVSVSKPPSSSTLNNSLKSQFNFILHVTISIDKLHVQLMHVVYRQRHNSILLSRQTFQKCGEKRAFLKHVM